MHTETHNKALALAFSKAKDKLKSILENSAAVASLSACNSRSLTGESSNKETVEPKPALENARSGTHIPKKKRSDDRAESNSSHGQIQKGCDLKTSTNAIPRKESYPPQDSRGQHESNSWSSKVKRVGNSSFVSDRTGVKPKPLDSCVSHKNESREMPTATISSSWPRREGTLHSGWPPLASIAAPKYDSTVVPTAISSKPWPRREGACRSGGPSRPPWGRSSWNIDYQRRFRAFVDKKLTSSTALDRKEQEGNWVKMNTIHGLVHLCCSTTKAKMSSDTLVPPDSQLNSKSDSWPNESGLTGFSILASNCEAKPAPSAAAAELLTETVTKTESSASTTAHRYEQEALHSATTSRPWPRSEDAFQSGRPIQPPWGRSSWNTEYQKRLRSSVDRLHTNSDKKPSAKFF